MIAAREQGRLALGSLHRGQVDVALDRLSDAVRRCPEDPQLQHDLARALWTAEEPARAIATMNVAIHGSGGEPAWIAELGTMLLEQGDTSGALEQADLALSKNPQLGEAWRLRGEIMLRKNELTTALSNSHRALSFGADAQKTLPLLAVIYERQGRPRRVLATCERLIRCTDPEQRPADLQLRKGFALAALQRHEDAIDSFERASSHQGNSPELLVALARSQAACGRTDSAAETARIAGQLYPQHPLVATLPVIRQSTDGGEIQLVRAEFDEPGRGTAVQTAHAIQSD